MTREDYAKGADLLSRFNKLGNIIQGLEYARKRILERLERRSISANIEVSIDCAIAVSVSATEAIGMLEKEIRRLKEQQDAIEREFKEL